MKDHVSDLLASADSSVKDKGASIASIHSVVKDHISGLLAPVQSAVKNHVSGLLAPVQSAVKDHINGLHCPNSFSCEGGPFFGFRRFGSVSCEGSHYWPPSPILSAVKDKWPPLPQFIQL